MSSDNAECLGENQRAKLRLRLQLRFDSTWFGKWFGSAGFGWAWYGLVPLFGRGRYVCGRSSSTPSKPVATSQRRRTEVVRSMNRYAVGKQNNMKLSN